PTGVVGKTRLVAERVARGDDEPAGVVAVAPRRSEDGGDAVDVGAGDEAELALAHAGVVGVEVRLGEGPFLLASEKPAVSLAQGQPEEVRAVVIETLFEQQLPVRIASDDAGKFVEQIARGGGGVGDLGGPLAPRLRDAVPGARTAVYLADHVAVHVVGVGLLLDAGAAGALGILLTVDGDEDEAALAAVRRRFEDRQAVLGGLDAIGTFLLRGAVVLVGLDTTQHAVQDGVLPAVAGQPFLRHQEVMDLAGVGPAGIPFLNPLAATEALELA